MKKKILFLFIICLVVLTGCKSKNKDVQKTNKEKKVKEERKISIVDLNSNSRPYAVVINNYPAATKVQSGLNEAYIIYEFPIEGGMSRSLALFKDIDDVRVGTIRSARQNYLDYVLENDAILVHFGGNYKANEEMPKLGIEHIDGNAEPPFYRDNPEGLATEHTAYGNLKDIMEYATNSRGMRTTTDVSVPLNYSVDEIDLSKFEGSITANNVYVPYSNYTYGVEFKYNSDSKRYERYIYEEPHKDYFNGEIYDTKNIIIVNVSCNDLNEGHTDMSGTDYLNINNIGNGEGYYISNGYAIPITWEKSSRESKTLYKYNGKEIDINDGNTYIMFQNSYLATTIE